MNRFSASVVFCLLLVASTNARGDGGVAAAQGYFSAHPGARAMLSGEEIVAYYGGPTLNTASVATANFVDTFLQDNAASLAVDYNTLEFRDAVTIANGTRRVYTYRQRIEGLLVFGSVIKVVVGLGPPERIGYVGAHRVPAPTAALPADVLTAQAAVDQ